MKETKLDSGTATANRKIRFILKVFAFYFLFFTLLGCDAFVRKFTRKSKKENLSEQEMVLVPQEYNNLNMTKEARYRQALLFWKSWQDELIGALLSGTSNKREVDCAKQAIKNLEELKLLLNQQKAKMLDYYITQMKKLKDSIEIDRYNMQSSGYRMTAERLKRAILRDFSLQKIKDSLL